MTSTLDPKAMFPGIPEEHITLLLPVLEEVRRAVAVGVVMSRRMKLLDRIGLSRAFTYAGSEKPDAIQEIMMAAFGSENLSLLRAENRTVARDETFGLSKNEIQIALNRLNKKHGTGDTGNNNDDVDDEDGEDGHDYENCTECDCEDCDR